MAAVVNVRDGGIGWCVVCQEHAASADPAHDHPQDLVDAALRNRREYYGRLAIEEVTFGTPVSPVRFLLFGE